MTCAINFRIVGRLIHKYQIVAKLVTVGLGLQVSWLVSINPLYHVPSCVWKGLCLFCYGWHLLHCEPLHWCIMASIPRSAIWWVAGDIGVHVITSLWWGLHFLDSLIMGWYNVLFNGNKVKVGGGGWGPQRCSITCYFDTCVHVLRFYLSAQVQ